MIEFLDVIRKVDLFSCLEENELIDLVSRFELINLKEGEILFSRGDSSDYIYIVISGHISSYLLDKDQQFQAIGTIEQGQILGEAGVLSEEPRMLTVKAIVATQLARLSAEQFKALCYNNPVILEKTAKTVIARSQLTMNFIADESIQQWHIIIPANPQVSIEEFKKRLKNNAVNYQNIFLVETNEVAVIKEMISHQNYQNNHIFLLVIISAEILSKLVDLIKVKAVYLLADNQGDLSIEPKLISLITNKMSQDYVKIELILLHDDKVDRPSNTIKWLEKFPFSFHYHIKQNRDEDYQRLLRFINGTSTVLVLGGGGAKGWFHVGLIKALTEKNIKIDAIGGVSAGAVVGACYLYDSEFNHVVDNLERITNTFYSITQVKNLTWPLVSFFKSSQALTVLQDIFQETKIEDLWRPFFCVTANLSLCSESAHYSGELASRLMASNSIPGVLPPCIINGQLHYDGGLINNLPIDVMRNRIGKKNKIIASCLSASSPDNTVYNFPQKIGLFQFLKARLTRTKVKTYPVVWDSFIKALLLGSSLKEKQTSEFADLLINPDLSKFSIYYLNKDQEQELLEFGYQEGLNITNNSEN
ncbi:patatin-like phospholipase family protein [Legionella drozanskii]|uniref:Patatin-like phospholipase n=1 Tax=Legionella drozanskii LLAP-1 TaxID=1212489 RepID=A0A0W0TDV3_9GAMM|nr:patatin-like phospholipase family protein [Legionella drozanskii]KTC93780.1 patatin-like phospholipase [Legionella drozanskii LLAP-1]